MENEYDFLFIVQAKIFTYSTLLVYEINKFIPN